MKDNQIKIWVDADGCPNAVKEILFRAANRAKIPIILVANRYLTIPKSNYIKIITVPSGFDQADNEIVKQLHEGDLVITSDIPLASQVIDKKGHVLTPSGQELSKENINYRLSIRNFMDSLRSSGVETKGDQKFSQSDRKNFADNFDRILHHLISN